MTNSVSTNITCDVFHAGGGPSGTPDLAGVACVLVPDYDNAHRYVASGSSAPAPFRWTHYLLVDYATDIRDSYDVSTATVTAPDNVFIPDKNGTRFAVRFVERVGRGTKQDQRKVYLDRAAPSWPS